MFMNVSFWLSLFSKLNIISVTSWLFFSFWSKTCTQFRLWLINQRYLYGNSNYFIYDYRYLNITLEMFQNTLLHSKTSNKITTCNTDHRLVLFCFLKMYMYNLMLNWLQERSSYNLCFFFSCGWRWRSACLRGNLWYCGSGEETYFIFIIIVYTTIKIFYKFSILKHISTSLVDLRQFWELGRYIGRGQLVLFFF